MLLNSKENISKEEDINKDFNDDKNKNYNNLKTYTKTTTVTKVKASSITNSIFPTINTADESSNISTTKIENNQQNKYTNVEMKSSKNQNNSPNKNIPYSNKKIKNGIEEKAIPLMNEFEYNNQNNENDKNSISENTEKNNENYYEEQTKTDDKPNSSLNKKQTPITKINFDSIQFNNINSNMADWVNDGNKNDNDIDNSGVNENNSSIPTKDWINQSKIKEGSSQISKESLNKIINDGLDIDKLLVVTFTNAAASEMRERIASAITKALEKTPNSTNLQKQLTLLSRANITTMHSFCLEVIRNNFQVIDLDPSFRILDETEGVLLKNEILDDLFEEKYENDDSNF